MHEFARRKRKFTRQNSKPCFLRRWQKDMDWSHFHWSIRTVTCRLSTSLKSHVSRIFFLNFHKIISLTGFNLITKKFVTRGCECLCVSFVMTHILMSFRDTTFFVRSTKKGAERGKVKCGRGRSPSGPTFLFRAQRLHRAPAPIPNNRGEKL